MMDHEVTPVAGGDWHVEVRASNGARLAGVPLNVVAAPYDLATLSRLVADQSAGDGSRRPTRNASRANTSR